MASTYLPPGVYITETTNPAQGGLPAGFRTIGLVATGSNTLPVSNTPVVKGTANGTDVIPVSTFTLVSVTAIGTVPNLAQFILGTDFTVSGNSITWLSSGQQPTTGSTYYVSWNRQKLAPEYLPQTFGNNMASIRNTYGFELNNGVYTPITVAANLMFGNGAPQIIISQALTSAVTDIQTAVDAMKAVQVDLLVVPQSCNTTLTQYVRNHTLTMSAPGAQHERVFISSSDGFSDATTTIVAKANLNSVDRFWMVAPPAFDMILQDAVTKSNQTVFLPGQYLAAAVAGAVANPANDAATPLTRQTIVGPVSYTHLRAHETGRNYLSQNGVMVLEFANGGGLQIRDGVTTDSTNVNTVTPSVRLIKDYILKTLRPLLDRTYIGTKITSQTPSQIATTIQTYLTGLIANTLITKIGTITVVQDSVDPRTIDVTLSFMPIYPLEIINVTFLLLLN